MSRKLRHRSHHGHSETAESHEHEQFPNDEHHEQELLAYQLWEERGSPFGSPDDDWFAAEAQLEREEEKAAHL